MRDFGKEHEGPLRLFSAAACDRVRVHFSLQLGTIYQNFTNLLTVCKVCAVATWLDASVMCALLQKLVKTTDSERRRREQSQRDNAAKRRPMNIHTQVGQGSLLMRKEVKITRAPYADENEMKPSGEEQQTHRGGKSSISIFDFSRRTREQPFHRDRNCS